MEKHLIVENSIPNMVVVRNRILDQLADTECELSKTKRHSPKRQDILEKKQLLLRQLREQKQRISETKKIKNSNRDSPITDHALVRWLERKHNIDIDKLKQKMIVDGLHDALRDRHRSYWITGDMAYFISEGLVTTVVPASDILSEAA